MRPTSRPRWEPVPAATRDQSLPLRCEFSKKANISPFDALYKTFVERKGPPTVAGTKEIRRLTPSMACTTVLRRRTRSAIWHVPCRFYRPERSLSGAEGHLRVFPRAGRSLRQGAFRRGALFKRAVEQSRWQAYPLGLAMVGELVEGIIREHADYNRRRAASRRRPRAPCLRPLCDARRTRRGGLDRQPSRELHRRLQSDCDACAKSAPETSPSRSSRRYFDCMPIHQKLRGSDFPTIPTICGATCATSTTN